MIFNTTSGCKLVSRKPRRDGLYALLSLYLFSRCRNRGFCTTDHLRIFSIVRQRIRNSLICSGIVINATSIPTGSAILSVGLAPLAVHYLSFMRSVFESKQNDSW